jgi:hypothetical protein
MSNFQILVFYSEKTNVTMDGNATEWDNFGFETSFPQLGKFIVMRLTNCVVISLGECKDKSSYLFLYES